MIGIGQFHSAVIDAPDPHALATFSAGLLDMEITGSPGEHLDVRIAAIDEAEPRVLALGARRLPGGGGDFGVHADPVGHPFRLVWDA